MGSRIQKQGQVHSVFNQLSKSKHFSLRNLHISSLPLLLLSRIPWWTPLCPLYKVWGVLLTDGFRRISFPTSIFHFCLPFSVPYAPRSNTLFLCKKLSLSGRRTKVQKLMYAILLRYNSGEKNSQPPVTQKASSPWSPPAPQRSICTSSLPELPGPFPPGQGN